MATYKLSKTGVINTDTGAYIPNASGNRHWLEFQRWLSAGNTADPADPAPPPLTDLDNANASLVNDPAFRALVKVLATHFGISVVALVAEIRAQV